MSALAEGLRKLKYEVWFDEKLEGGQVWWEEILHKIRDCDVFVVALAPETLGSEACKREWKYAAAVKRNFLPIVVTDGVRPKTAPEELSKLQWVDYREENQGAAFELFAALNGLPETPPLPEPLPEPPPVPVSYLGSLKEKVETSDKLTANDQKALIFDFEEKIDRQEDRTAILDLLDELKKRPDVLSVISTKIGDLETRLGTPAAKTATKTRKPARTGAKKAGRKGTKKVAAKAPKKVTRKATGRVAKKAAKKAPKKATKKTAKRAPKASAKKTAKKSSKSAATTGRKPEIELMVRLQGGNQDLIDLLGHIVKEKDDWRLEIDDLDHLTLCFEGKLAGYVVAVASCRDKVSLPKQKALKGLGWQTSGEAVAKSIVGGAVAYATGGVGLLALGSKKVRDLLLRFEATRRWRVPKAGAKLQPIAGDLASALQAIAPQKRAFIARREPPDS